MAKYYITTPIYYVNAKPHIGSAYTSIAADVLARYRRQHGDDVFFLMGTAEHGAKMAGSAEKAGKETQAFMDEMSGEFQKTWDDLNIKRDGFLRTTEKRHEAAVKIFFEKLKESGKIYEAEYEGLYCIGHEAFVKEADLTPEGLCPDHGTKPELVKENNWFFKLSEYQEILREKIVSKELLVEPEGRRNEVLAFIDKGLEDIAISRQNVTWAIPLPWDASQTIYVWLDELFSYCSGIGYGEDQEKFKKWWPADLHLVGKDIIKFHCIIWPALLMAIGEDIPKKVFAHGFFTVDGQKMSKTLGNVVDPRDLVAEYGADVVRYFLLRDFAFGNDGDFSHERLKDRYNSDLANGLGNLVSRTLNMFDKYCDQNDVSVSTVLSEEVVILAKEADAFVEELAFHKALASIWKLVAFADELIEKHKPWELVKNGDTEKAQEIIHHAVAVLELINERIAPFMPETHEKLSVILSAKPLKKPENPLFARKD
jgi:methionyl-tRNA synthetase